MFRRLSIRGVGLGIGLVILTSMTGAPAAAGTVFLNEVGVHGFESVELYNRGPDTVDVSGWRIVGSDGDFVIADSTVIEPETYLQLKNLGGIFDEIGGETSVIDLTGNPLDGVLYGIRGGAPLPPALDDATIARAPDASVIEPPPSDPLNDAFVWTIAFTPTEAAPNTAPVPALGTTVRLNEASPEPGAGAPDALELFNPAASGVDVTGWFVIAGGEGPISLPSVQIGEDGALGFDLGSVQLENTEVVYLFTADSTRVDQLGFHGAPPLEDGECFARLPDGTGSPAGYDFATSDLVLDRCSIGEKNCPLDDCNVPVRERSWGEIKSSYR